MKQKTGLEIPKQNLLIISKELEYLGKGLQQLINTGEVGITETAVLPRTSFLEADQRVMRSPLLVLSQITNLTKKRQEGLDNLKTIFVDLINQDIRYNNKQINSLSEREPKTSYTIQSEMTPEAAKNFSAKELIDMFEKVHAQPMAVLEELSNLENNFINVMNELKAKFHQIAQQREEENSPINPTPPM
ncbi:MAG: hypothetical protein ACHP6H_01070 [Legionellales bacterium]